MATLTCHTENCENAEIPIEMDLTFIDEEGHVQQVRQAFCGVCNQPITDIKD